MSNENEATAGQILRLMRFWLALMTRLTTKAPTTQNLINNLEGFKTLALVLTAKIIPIGPEGGIEVSHKQEHQVYLHGTERAIRRLRVHERVWLGYLNPDWVNQEQETHCRTLGKIRFALQLAGMRCANYYHLVGLAPHLVLPCLPYYQAFDDVQLPPQATHFHPSLRLDVGTDNGLSWVENCNHDYNYMNRNVGVLVVMKTEILSPLAHDD